MPDTINVLDGALAEVKRLKARLAQGNNRQVQGQEDLVAVKATALSWVRNHRKAVPALKSALLSDVDSLYSRLMVCADRSTLRSRYRSLLGELAQALVDLRTEVIQSPPEEANSAEVAPDFSQIVRDADMQQILARRWSETVICVGAGAPLAATVMMGAILEALLLSRANQLADKRPLFRAKATPKDRSSKPIPLGDWTLKNYLEVGYELGWIRRPARDVGTLLRDYRNYIHPAKELSHGIHITVDDASMLWSICASLARQLAKP